MCFNKILVPYDGSKYSNRAFKNALDIAKKNDSKITVVTVIDGYYAVNFSYVYQSDPGTIKKLTTIAEKPIIKLKASAKKEGVPFSSKILQGYSIVKTLVDFTKSGNFDLVVMGSHGRTGFSNFILGSISNGIVHHVKCPVMIVK